MNKTKGQIDTCSGDHQEKEMPRYIVQRNIAGARVLGHEALNDIARKSRQVISGMDVPYVGVETYVKDDAVCCIHVAENAEVIYRRAREGGFPADLVIEIDDSHEFQPLKGVLNELRDEFGSRRRASSPREQRRG